MTDSGTANALIHRMWGGHGGAGCGGEFEDYVDWIDMRAHGRDRYLTRLALRRGLPTGLGLAVLAFLGHLASGDALPASVALESWFLTSGAVVLTTIAGRAEWRHLERTFGDR